MILIGMFDSPFVRRVAISLHLLEVPFVHRNWSVGKDFELVRQFNPLGRVPALVLPDGEVLIDSVAILDFIDDTVGPGRALLPPSATSAAGLSTSYRSRSARQIRVCWCSTSCSSDPRTGATLRGSSGAAIRCTVRWPKSIGSRRRAPGSGWSADE